MTNFQPMHDRVLVKKNPVPTKSVGGILIPETTEGKPQDGYVLAVGPGKIEAGIRIPVNVEVGDKIIFGKNAGNDIEIDGETYTVMFEREIIAKIKETNNND